MRKTFLFAAFIAGALSFTACNKHNGCSRSEKAWVRDFTNDTCGIVFELEDGTKLEPTNLAEFQNQLEFTEGALIWLSYKDVDGASTCGLGEIIEIRCVAEREY